MLKSGMTKMTYSIFCVIFICFCYLETSEGRRPQTQPKRCLLFRKKCVDFCPMGMHPYHTRCDDDTLSQKTCTSPEIYTLGFTCGWSRCDCNGDLLLTEDYLCVKREECPPPSSRRLRRPRRRQGRRKLKFDTDIVEEFSNVDIQDFNVNDEKEK